MVPSSTNYRNLTFLTKTVERQTPLCDLVSLDYFKFAFIQILLKDSKKH